MTRILVTGCSSGLGRYLKELLGAEGWQRGPVLERYYDTIIHCAHDRANPQEAVNLLNDLFKVPCGKFVFMSTIDVHKAYNVDCGQYGLWKLRGEQFVRASHPHHLILRLGAMVGRYSRDNSITRLLMGVPLSVTRESSFGVVRHESIVPYLEEIGTYTVCGNVVTLEQIASWYGITPKYGDYRYQSPDISPSHSSRDEILKFVRDHMDYHDLGRDYGLCPMD